MEYASQYSSNKNLFGIFFICFAVFNVSLMLETERFIVFQHILTSSWPYFQEYNISYQVVLNILAIFWAPLIHLYLSGPEIPVLGGFWKGKSMKEMCYLLTNDLHYQDLNSIRCQELLFNGFESVYTVCHVVILFWFLWIGYNFLSTRWMYERIVDHAIKRFKDNTSNKLK
jgi:hypothetical protein